MKKLAVILVVSLVIISPGVCQSQVNLTWFGQSVFLMKTGDGVKILIDPANPGMVKVDLKEEVDLVTVSHEHGDHNYVALAKGDPVVLRGLSGKEVAKIDQVFKGVRIRTVASFHDNQGGTQRGSNAIFIFEMPGLKVVHMGDLGHSLSEAQVKEIGTPDIIMIPVGTGFTLDLQSAVQVIKQLNPKVLIPMHYSPADAPAGGFRLGTVEDFIKAAGPSFEVRQTGHSETFISGKLPPATTIVVMKTAE